MKYKSYAFWTSLSAAVVVLIGILSSAFGFEADQKLVTDIIMAICGILVVLGVVKMPAKEPEEKMEEDQAEELEEKPTEDKTQK